MDSYPDILLRTMRKVFIIPQDKVDKITKKLNTIFSQYKIHQINKQQVHNQLFTLINKLTRTSPRCTRLNERISTIDSLLKSHNFTPKKILDIGAGNGEIISMLKTHYKLPHQDVFAIDQKLPETINATALNYVNGNIPLPDNSIDLIIMLVVLHHIPPDERSNILSEVNRILTTDGVLIIREHDDIKTLDFQTFIEILHIFWYLVSKETADPLHLMSRTETQELLKFHQLIPIAYHAYDTASNPQHLYYEVYSKI